MKKRNHKCFRLLSELYSLLYNLRLKDNIITLKNSFRLLSELYSLLFVELKKSNNINEKKCSFRLLSELYSLLLCYISIPNFFIYKFPSPLGVIFSLIEVNLAISVPPVPVSVSSRSYILSY